jgi:deoxyribonuclease-4
MREVGLHVRLNDSFLALAQRAQELQQKIFQCFFISQATHRHVPISDEEVATFVRDYRSSFASLYLHGSYWINLASVRYSPQKVFFRERDLAERLGFTHMILHPGSATGGKTRTQGIDALAQFLNQVCAQPNPIKIVLENGTHAGLSVGGDLDDFKKLMEKIEYPDRIFFCIDTAHAYSYGYDVHDAKAREQFIAHLDAAVGFSRIVLTHLNDTKERLGSRIDRHAIIGQGNIGLDALRDFVTDPRLQHADIILELPPVSDEEEKQIYEMVKEWSHLKK